MSKKDKNFEPVSKRKGAVLNDHQILEGICDYLGVTAYKLSKELGYKAPASLYHIKEGRTNFSNEMIEKLLVTYPSLSYVYLNTGKGDPNLKTPAEIQAQKNVMRHIYKDEPQQSNASQMPSVDVPIEYTTQKQLELLLRSQNRTNELLSELIDKMENFTASAFNK